MLLVMNNDGAAADEGAVYEIRIKGRLPPHWADWFECMSITPDENGDTLLTGRLADQAALYGVLKKVRDLGLPLLALNCLKPPFDQV
jgi:hypothetical protein